MSFHNMSKLSLPRSRTSFQFISCIKWEMVNGVKSLFSVKCQISGITYWLTINRTILLVILHSSYKIYLNFPSGDFNYSDNSFLPSSLPRCCGNIEDPFNSLDTKYLNIFIQNGKQATESKVFSTYYCLNQATISDLRALGIKDPFEIKSTEDLQIEMKPFYSSLHTLYTSSILYNLVFQNGICDEFSCCLFATLTIYEFVTNQILI